MESQGTGELAPAPPASERSYEAGVWNGRALAARARVGEAGARRSPRPSGARMRHPSPESRRLVLPREAGGVGGRVRFRVRLAEVPSAAGAWGRRVSLGVLLPR